MCILCCREFFQTHLSRCLAITGILRRKFYPMLFRVSHCTGLILLNIFRHEKSLWSMSKRKHFYFPSRSLRCTLITCLLRVTTLMAPNSLNIFQEPPRFLLCKLLTFRMKSNQRLWIIYSLSSQCEPVQQVRVITTSMKISRVHGPVTCQKFARSR